jgi:transposase
MDESGFATLPNVQRSWSPIGKPHCADAGDYRKRINVLGALDYRTGHLEYDLHMTNVTQKEVKDFLQRLAERSDPKRMTVIVLDNARIHHAITQEQLDIWLCDYRFCLWFLPTYSPELNLIEHLWKQAKYHWRRFKTWKANELSFCVNNLLGLASKLSYA